MPKDIDFAKLLKEVDGDPKKYLLKLVEIGAVNKDELLTELLRIYLTDADIWEIIEWMDHSKPSQYFGKSPIEKG